ncbi:MAG TPA: hypothetical protein DEG09_04225 [Marinilabiliaceae bacterium]|nr:hypothetical protein [Marinilabiliaceae bacterium]
MSSFFSYKQKGGYLFTGEPGGGSWGPYRAEHTEEITDAHLLIGVTGGFGKAKSPLDALSKSLEKIADISVEFDRKKGSDGRNAGEADVNGRTGDMEEAKEVGVSDSIVIEVTKRKQMFSFENGLRSGKNENTCFSIS